MGSHSTATFPVGGTIPATDGAYAKYQEQLGMEITKFDGPLLKRWRLVQATNADTTSNRKFAYKYTLLSAYTVELCGNGEVPCGVQKSDQESLLAAGALFWLQIEGLATCVVDDGSNVAINVPLDVTATGEVATVADEGAVSETILGWATAAANDDADVVVRLRPGL